jgi:hypothetical protein
MNIKVRWLLATTAFIGVVALVVVAMRAADKPTPKPATVDEQPEQAPRQKPVEEMTEAEKKAFVEKLLQEKGLFDPRGWHFPKTAAESL